MTNGKELLSGELLEQVEQAARAKGLREEDVPRLVSEVRREIQEL